MAAMTSTAPHRTGSRRILDVVRPPHDDAPDTFAIVLRAGGLGVLAAVVGLALALLLVVTAWAVVPHPAGSSTSAPFELSVGVWLLAHHVALDLPTGPLQLTPLLWVLVPLGLTFLGGRQAARSLRPVTLGDVGRALVVLALGYALTAAVVAGVVASATMRPHALQAFVWAGLLAAVGGGWGLLRGSGLQQEAWLRVPFGLRQATAAGTAALLGLVAVSALLVALLLAVGFSDALQMWRTLQPGGPGGLGLALLTVSTVPNLVIWAAAFLVGPGFAVGTGTHVSAQGIDYGALPVFPPLAALPPAGLGSTLLMIGVVVPVAAGVLAGWMLHRRMRDAAPHEVALWGLAAGGVAGAWYAVLGLLSSGPVTAGRMHDLGVGLPTGLLLAAEVGLVAAAVAWECHRRSSHGHEGEDRSVEAD